MTIRHGLLTVAALAVLGVGVYLFIAVRATPAATTARVRPDSEPRPRTTEVTAPPPKEVADTPGRTGQLPEITSVRPMQTQPHVARVEATEVKPALDGTTIQRLDATMSEANKAYDRGEFEEAKVIAQKVIAQDPTNVRMLRLLVSSSCIEGESVEAQKHFQMLPPPDREQMKVRCARYGVTFGDS